MKTLKFNNPEMRLYVKSMGKLFQVTAVCQSTEEANKISERHPNQLTIAEDCNGLIYMAEQYCSVGPSTLIPD